jgi:hypothetical protein
VSALCADRVKFVEQREIREATPEQIWTYIVHFDSSAQIKGFQELFVHINNDPNADNLRLLIHGYFANSESRWLKAHLRKFVLLDQMMSILTFPIAQKIPTPRHLHSLVIFSPIFR